MVALNDDAAESGSMATTGPTEGARYLAVNTLALLDAETEYFIDSETAELFFIPPTTSSQFPTGADVVLSQRTTAHNISGVSNVVIRGLQLVVAVGPALAADNVSNVVVENCTVGNAGTVGVQLSGTNSTFATSTVYGAGCSAVSMAGGDAVTLSRGNLLVTNNSIHSFGRVSRTLRVGISWQGCGNNVTFNEIFNAPHSGIMISPASDGVGVLHRFEGNHLHDLCQGTADAGGFYAGRTWANRGNIIRGNLFQRLYATELLFQKTSVNGICA
jgi:hypothetical protein